MSNVKTLGVLTSGGDCAGLNAVIRAVTYHAIQGYGWKVLGILDGTSGLMDDPPRYRELSVSMFDQRLLREGGTFLGTTNKGNTNSLGARRVSCTRRRKAVLSRSRRARYIGKRISLAPR